LEQGNFDKMKTLEQHLVPGGVKKILALDGGGIRGALTLGYLKRIEDILKEKSPDPDSFRLCDYFDLIGGTSTGSIIAAALAVGMTVDEIKEKYIYLGKKIFSRKWVHINFLFSRYSNRALTRELKALFKEIQLGGPEIKTGLCIVAKRIDTNSTWFFHNNPKGMYYGSNRHIYLWEMVKASSSAPSYFLPTIVDVGNGEKGAFVDGGVSLSNNPALSLLMISQLKGFHFGWTPGEDNIHLYSLGTGYGSIREKYSGFRWKTHGFWAMQISNFYMEDANWHNQAILQWLSNSESAIQIDTEVDTLEGDLIVSTSALSYYRFNFEFTVESVRPFYQNEQVSVKHVRSLLAMDNPANRELLYQIGLKDAEKIKPAYFKMD
jgi:hypothetical protein